MFVFQEESFVEICKCLLPVTDCSGDAATSECALTIINGYLGSGTHYEKYNSWRDSNTRLNWYGAQPEQGTYYGVPAQGSPMVWTTNVVGQVGYQPINMLVNVSNKTWSSK